MTINFSVTKDEAEIISLIAERADREVYGPNGIDQEIIHTEMDITACHANGCPLKLDELLAADRFNFAHDVTGIRARIDRSTGKLTGCFLPRYASLEQSE